MNERKQAGGGSPRQRRTASGVSGLLGLAIALTAVTAGHAQDATPASPVAVQPGQLTAERPFLVPAAGAAVSITPILTSGETVGDY
jgi:hypothetical protein